MRPALEPVSFHQASSGARSDALSSALPPDLLEQVRGRVSLLSLFILAAFGFDLVLVAGRFLAATSGFAVATEPVSAPALLMLNLLAAAGSVALWRAARSRRVSASRLHSLGLAYEIAICFVIAMLSFWQGYAERGVIPGLTWVPAVVILFPLILPGPPRRTLVASIVAGSMAPVALLVLHLTGMVPADQEAFAQAVVASAFAVVFAHLGARIIYGLGRQVAVARELGSYRLVERLGQGGMGEVWRAEHRLLARPAAVKLMRPFRAGEAPAPVAGETRRRFEREALATARLCSPHTVSLFDFGVSADGAFYYVMELLDGMDAERLVRRFGAVPPERAIFLLRQVCHSLAEAEARGLVHRDIKPANIFICRYGEDRDFVKVLDFGLVKAFGEAADDTLTRETAIAGTPAYMAPEQALGRPDLDGRADIYATGCVAYWLLTGEQLFKADSAVGLLLQHAQTPPAGPSSRSAHTIPPELDRTSSTAWPRSRQTGPRRHGSCPDGCPRWPCRPPGPSSGRATGGAPSWGPFHGTFGWLTPPALVAAVSY